MEHLNDYLDTFIIVIIGSGFIIKL